MKILHICTDRNIGGAGIWITNLVKCLDKEPFESAVLLPEGAELAPILRQEGIEVTEVPIAEKSLDIKAIFTLSRAISAFDPDIVHTHGSLSGRMAARLRGKKVIVTRHWVSLPEEAKKRGFATGLAGQANAKLADMFIATARQAAENLRESGIPAEKIRVIQNGVPPLSRLPESLAKEERERNGAAGFTIGMLARLEPVKGHVYLLEAARILKEKGRDFTILLAGTGSKEAQLKKTVQALDLEDRVRFLGFCDKPADFLSSIDVQVNASYTETSCLALLEGMSIGLVAIASDGGGNRDVISHGENGLIFPVSDSKALADCIERLMDDNTLRAEMSKKALAIYKEKFTGDMFARQVENLYLDIRPGGGKERAK